MLHHDLFEGDPVMDEYIKAHLDGSSHKSDWREFHQALSSDNPLAFRGSGALHQLIQSTCINPDWADWKLIEEGVIDEADVVRWKRTVLYELKKQSEEEKSFANW